MSPVAGLPGLLAFAKTPGFMLVNIPFLLLLMTVVDEI